MLNSFRSYRAIASNGFTPGEIFNDCGDIASLSGVKRIARLAVAFTPGAFIIYPPAVAAKRAARAIAFDRFVLAFTCAFCTLLALSFAFLCGFTYATAATFGADFIAIAIAFELVFLALAASCLLRLNDTL